ncbi:hypothetical protein B0H10DRAFT_300538 [Mycena sp. CBHHK59/15]|nr:hypothetical protein B0H10DRAFT_300538 [Mycena sp. CBHHK59/15]
MKCSNPRPCFEPAKMALNHMIPFTASTNASMRCTISMAPSVSMVSLHMQITGRLVLPPSCTRQDRRPFQAPSCASTMVISGTARLPHPYLRTHMRSANPDPPSHRPHATSAHWSPTRFMVGPSKTTRRLTYLLDTMPRMARACSWQYRRSDAYLCAAVDMRASTDQHRRAGAAGQEADSSSPELRAVLVGPRSSTSVRRLPHSKLIGSAIRDRHAYAGADVRLLPYPSHSFRHRAVPRAGWRALEDGRPSDGDPTRRRSRYRHLDAAEGRRSDDCTQAIHGEERQNGPRDVTHFIRPTCLKALPASHQCSMPKPWRIGNCEPGGARWGIGDIGARG